MASSLQSQLSALSSSLLSTGDLKKKPYTKCSILFDPKEAADLSTDDIHVLALEGLNALCAIDSSFMAFKKTLFSTESVRTDRELENKEYNDKLNKSINSFLRILSRHLMLSHSHKALEYLIRRYKVYVYNVDELLLCALPYHETTLFVRIVQIVNLMNTKWHFLSGVKSSGAPLIRSVLVQQCTRVPSLLQTIYEYTIQIGKNQQCPQQLVSFCVAVVIETLDAVKTVDTDLINRLLPFILYCFETTVGQEFKVGGLMIVCRLADRATLTEKLVQKLICLIARPLKRNEDSLDYTSLVQMSLMVFVKLTQTQEVHNFPWKALEALSNIRDLSMYILELSKTFNIELFTWLILAGLLHHSFSQKSCQEVFIDLINSLPMKAHLTKLVSKLLALSADSEKTAHSTPESITWIRRIFLEIEKSYSLELENAVCLSIKKLQSSSTPGCDSKIKALGTLLDGTVHIPSMESNATIYMSLEHPEPQMRASAVANLATSGLLGDGSSDMKKINLQEMLLRRLHDEDLNVVNAVLSLNGLERTVADAVLLKSLCDVLAKCHSTLRTGSSESREVAERVACSCFDFLVLKFLSENPDQTKNVSAVIFPYILILSKTKKMNIKALQMARRIPFSFFKSLSTSQDVSDTDFKKLDKDQLVPINSKMVELLSKALLEDPAAHLPWLLEYCSRSSKGKSLIFLIFTRTYMQISKDNFWPITKGCLPFLKKEWINLTTNYLPVQAKPMDKSFFDNCDLYKKLENEDEKSLGSLLLALFWTLIRNAPSKNVGGVNDESQETVSIFEELFMLFATSSCRSILKEHIHLIVTHKSLPVIQFLSKFFMEKDSANPVPVKVESLNALTSLCRTLSQAESSDKNGISIGSLTHWQLALPSVLVPLCSSFPDVRSSAIESIEALHDLFSTMAVSMQKNGTDASHKQFLPIDAFLEFTKSIVQLKHSFNSDGNFLRPFLSSAISLSGVHITVPDSIHKRFDSDTKLAILLFLIRTTLDLPTYAKCKLLSALQQAGHEDKQVAETKGLLSKLMLQRNSSHLKPKQRLSLDEIELLCILLKIVILHLERSSILENKSEDVAKPVFDALCVEHGTSEDDAVIKPCISVLESISLSLYSSQPAAVKNKLFQKLILLYSSDVGAIRNSALDALRRINVDGDIVKYHLEIIITNFGSSGASKKKQKRRKLERNDLSNKTISQEQTLNFTHSLLEFLSWKKDLKNRSVLVGLLFHLLEWIMDDKHIVPAMATSTEGVNSSTVDNVKQTQIDDISFLQQMLMSVLEDILNLSCSEDVTKDIGKNIDVNLVVRSVKIAKDSISRNHALLLLIAVAKNIPKQILSHVVDVFSTIGESTIIQDDSQSQKVSEQLISVMAPIWMDMCDDPKQLLKVFVKALPYMIPYRRLALMKHLLGLMGEKKSLPALLELLLEESIFTSCTEIADNTKKIKIEANWELDFARQLSGIYSFGIWLFSIVRLLQWARFDAGNIKLMPDSSKNEESFKWKLQIEAINLAGDYLNSTETLLMVESGSEQETFNALMEQAVLHLHALEKRTECLKMPSGVKENIKKALFRLLDGITKLLSPSAYCRSITSLLRHSDINISLMGLQVLSDNLRGNTVFYHQHRSKGKNVASKSSNWNLLGKESEEDFNAMVLKIGELLDAPQSDHHKQIKLSAISAFNTLAKKFPGKFSNTFANCLGLVVKHLTKTDPILYSECLRCIATLIIELGPQALPELPVIMQHVLDGTATDNSEVWSSLLVALESVVRNLGGFMNPYLADIIGILVLTSQFIEGTQLELCKKASGIRDFISESIPVRLLVDPIVKVYEKAVKKGEVSVSLLFDMVAVVASKMDRSSVAAYHSKIFDFCLLALELRSQHLESIVNVGKAEQSVINALVSLTMKLSETTFRPLFVRTLDWAETEIDTDGSSAQLSIERTISFYNFIDSLAGKLRSVFVPYFQYLIEGCAKHLMTRKVLDNGTQPKHKKKKRKMIDDMESKQTLSELEWHLRMLVISSLHKCFLYDTLGFLDKPKFEKLLQPIVSQLTVAPPESVEQFKEIPSIQEADDILVSCLGQMALTAGVDYVKQLNHEVLMRTRSDMVRAKILSLRVVKFVVEHLKEEYLTLLPETIPFLSELLEDSSLDVNAKAQELVKFLEDLSGESLSQYL